jgi:hypothetical protein
MEEMMEAEKLADDVAVEEYEGRLHPRRAEINEAEKGIST